MKAFEPFVTTRVDKQQLLGDVSTHIKSGMTIGIGGWGGRRKPMAAVRALLRSDVKDLTVVSYGGPDVGMLCAAGKIKKLIFGFVSLDVIPLEAHFRKSRQSGQIEVLELDEGLVQLGLRAAAARLPFLPTRIGLGSDVMKRNPTLTTVQSPYKDRETLLAMPSLRLDAALIHVNRADARGNNQILGPDPFFDEWFARAADCVLLSCDELVDTASFNNTEAARFSMPIERSLVHSVIPAPFGAHPTSCAPRYGIDVAHLKAYSASAAEDDGWLHYMERYITSGEEEYIASVGGADAITQLPLPVF